MSDTPGHHPASASSKVVVACPHCGKAFAVDQVHLGRPARCSGCAQVFELRPEATGTAPAAPATAGEATGGGGGIRCPVCQSAVAPGDATVICPDCRTLYHQDCWEYNKGCGVYGCSQVPPTEKLDSLEIPAGYWGQDQKPCPWCGRTILAAAVRCRWCGAQFESARPQTTQDFRNQTAQQWELPKVRKAAIWLLVFALLPCTAPGAAVVGWIWYSRHAASIRKLPALFSAMCKIAIGVALVETILVVTVLVVHAVAG